ncbi:MAG: aminotransferase class IV, partial [Chitinophagaceae bacterium]
MNFLNYNGKFVGEGTPIIPADNRGLRYGDGLFETIKYKNNEFVLVDDHLSRLWNGMSKLQFERPKLFTPDFLEAEMKKLLAKNKLTSARIRV